MTEIDREHPEYSRNKRTLQMYRDLYTGGQQFTHKAAQYLLRRQKEPLDVYGERLQRTFYQNYVGSIVDWYAATLFRRAPSLQLDGGIESGRRFLVEFADDCDRHGASTATFFQTCFTDALVTGISHILIDFPKSSAIPATRAEEDATGISRAYVVRYQAEDLVNWSIDERGDYEWVVLRQTNRRQPTIDSPEVTEETHWFYYDRSEYRTYRRAEVDGRPGPIQMISRGPHGMAHQHRVPLVSLRVTDGLWLLNKAAHLQLEHFNKSNALGWAITMGLFAMPVIYSDREWNQIVGESYYVQLGPQDKFGWAEPDGKVYTIAASNLETLKEEIYRVCYLSQASGEMAGGHAQSASSKQMDFKITEEVLRAYALAMKDCIRKVFTAVSEARQDGVSVSVSGLDEVDITDFGTELDGASKLLSLGIDSPTLKRQIFERLAFKYLSDARQEVKDQIAREVAAQLS
jgi:hypothetical protein